MRTTVDLNDELLRRAKRKAADEGITLREVIERALRTQLEARGAKKQYALKWRPTKGDLMPGVDLDDRDSLFDRMEGRG